MKGAIDSRASRRRSSRATARCVARYSLVDTPKAGAVAVSGYLGEAADRTKRSRPGTQYADQVERDHAWLEQAVRSGPYPPKMASDGWLIGTVASRVTAEQVRIPIDVGSGHVVVMLPGFALAARAYHRTAETRAPRSMSSSRTRALSSIRRLGLHVDRSRLRCSLDARDIEAVTMIAIPSGRCPAGLCHALARANRRARVRRHARGITRVAARSRATRHPFRLLRMATPIAAGTFLRSLVTHPREVAQAAVVGVHERSIARYRPGRGAPAAGARAVGKSGLAVVTR